MTNRRESIVVNVGRVPVGGDNPIVVQSMTDTDTANIAATVAQSKILADAGSEIVRRQLDDQGCNVPLVGDFHFIGHRLLREHQDCATTLDKFRINPGNVGRGPRHDENFRTFIEIARDLGNQITNLLVRDAEAVQPETRKDGDDVG